MGGSGSNVFPQVRCFDCLTKESLGGFPALSDHRGDVRVLHLLVDVGSSLGKGTLHKLTLRESSSQEDRINPQEDPRTFAKGQCRQQEAEPQQDL